MLAGDEWSSSGGVKMSLFGGVIALANVKAGLIWPLMTAKTWKNLHVAKVAGSKLCYDGVFQGICPAGDFGISNTERALRALRHGETTPETKFKMKTVI